ncbi:hypothetical protein TNIN_360371 [Trichonephila inaurata madagascariensis]|uniref:Uncharacterized protein n=1 Tax=Trichonephila inaurata madagascariensis TaxID=2747483 RepID=A0A8X6YR64_9ARAC|nr:hypothetical protein TNIN_360371 [Trichonephila inaurata madagascariensis]
MYRSRLVCAQVKRSSNFPEILKTLGKTHFHKTPSRRTKLPFHSAKILARLKINKVWHLLRHAPGQIIPRGLAEGEPLKRREGAKTRPYQGFPQPLRVPTPEARTFRNGRVSLRQMAPNFLPSNQQARKFHFVSPDFFPFPSPPPSHAFLIVGEGRLSWELLAGDGMTT